MTARRRALWAAAGVAAVLLAGRALAGVIADHEWYAALGAASLWRMRLTNTLLLRGGTGVLGALFAFANLYAVRRSIQSVILPRRVGGVDIGQELSHRTLLAAAVLLALVLGGVLALGGPHWMELALARIGRPFAEADPYFQADLGLFVYWLPLERALYRWALVSFAVVSAVVVTLYALTPSLRWEQGALVVTNYVRRHLVLLGCLLLVLVAWSARLDAFGVLLDGSGPGGAVVAVDHRVRIPVNVWLAFLTFVAALVVFWFGISGQVRVAATAVLAVIVLSLALRHLAPAVAARGMDAREGPYLETQASYTRRAYGVDRLLRLPATLRFATLQDAVPAVSLWDPSLLVQWLGHAPPSGGRAPALGWAATPDGLVALLAQQRAGVTGQPQAPWTVDRVPATAVQLDGRPPAAHAVAADSVRDSVPPVLVGDSAAGYTTVSDAGGAIPAPSLQRTLSRVAFAWSLQNPALLARGTAPGARLVLRRGVRERVGALAPFFTQGATLTPLLVRDSLRWVVELYATSAAYPLSTPLRVGGRRTRYVQHAATAVVNAHTGAVQLVADPQPDPLTASWLGALPGLFTSWATLDSALASALPPDVDGARVQALALARAGASGAPLDGTVPEPAEADSVSEPAPVPLLSMTPDAAALTWTSAVLDSLGRIAGVVVATGGRDRRATWGPLTTPGPSWAAALERLARPTPALASDSDDARAGRVRVAPTRAGLALVQPFYVSGALAAPRLSSMRVLAGDTVRVGQTFAAALDTSVAGAPPVGAPSGAPFRAAVVALYEQMRTALARGDLAAFGRAYAALGALLATAGP